MTVACIWANVIAIRCRRAGGHEPEVRRATNLLLDPIAALTGQIDPEEIAELIRPEDVAERLAQAEEDGAWFTIFADALGRRVT